MAPNNAWAESAVQVSALWELWPLMLEEMARTKANKPSFLLYPEMACIVGGGGWLEKKLAEGAPMC